MGSKRQPWVAMARYRRWRESMYTGACTQETTVATTTNHVTSWRQEVNSNSGSSEGQQPRKTIVLHEQFDVLRLLSGIVSSVATTKGWRDKYFVLWECSVTTMDTFNYGYSVCTFISWQHTSFDIFCSMSVCIAKWATLYPWKKETENDIAVTVTTAMA